MSSSNQGSLLANATTDQDVLLVDFFDTCVTRNVHPEYIKYLWSGIIREILGLTITSCEVYRIRNAIEAEICEENRSQGLDQDFYFPLFSRRFHKHIREIYRDINQLFSEDKFVMVSSNIELELELKYQSLLTDTIEYLEKEKEAGKILILVSDFYLSKDEFVKILKHHGIDKLFSEIYVSSEYSLTKRSGRLFDLVIKESSLDTSRTTMIGDNLHSDHDIPKSKGLNAIHLDKTSKKTQDDEHFNLTTCLSQTSQSTWNEISTLLADGPIFSNMVFTLYSFTRRLYRKLRENNVKDVFFLSREGEFLKKIFDLYQQKLAPEKFIKTHYFLASRKSTFLPSLSKLEEENFEILFRQYVTISAKEFLLSLNLEESWVETFQEEFTEDLKNRQEHFPSSQIFSKILSSEKFKIEYERRRFEQKKLFLKYVESFGVNIEKNEFSIVDVGWKGSMQDNLRRIVPEETNIHGYYLGLYTNPNITKSNIKEGIIFSPQPDAEEYGAWIFSNTLTVYEILLGASHGSATHYFETSSGQVDVSLTAHPYEIKLYQEKIKPLLDTYYGLFSKLCDIFNKTHFSIELFDRMIAEFHASMVLMPSKEELFFIETVSHFENFGVFEFTEFRSKNISFFEKTRNLFLFLKNPHEILKDSMWPAITFNELGLPFLRRFYGWYLFKLAFDDGNSKAFKIARRVWKI